MIDTECEIMNTRLQKENIKGLASKSHWIVFNQKLIKISETENPTLVFLCVAGDTGEKVIEYFVNIIMPVIKNDYNVVVASEDATFPNNIGDYRYNGYKTVQVEIAVMLRNQYIKNIFVENLDSLNPKYYPIPLGLLNYTKDFANCHEIHKNLQINTSREIDLFCCHRLRGGDQFKKRFQVRELAANEWKNLITYYDVLDEDQYQNLLLKSKFCVCVQGGGYDPSPKCWQALICGCIPIIENSPVNRAYQRFPVVFVDCWDKDTITEQKLQDWYDRLSPYYLDVNKRTPIQKMLQLDYWHKIITENILDFESIAIQSPLMEKFKNNILISYGSDEIVKDVTIVACQHFFKGDVFEIEKSVNFNNIFGDIHVGVKKYLRFFFDNEQTCFSFPEMRTKKIIICLN